MHHGCKNVKIHMESCKVVSFFNLLYIILSVFCNNSLKKNYFKNKIFCFVRHWKPYWLPVEVEVQRYLAAFSALSLLLGSLHSAFVIVSHVSQRCLTVLAYWFISGLVFHHFNLLFPQVSKKSWHTNNLTMVGAPC